MTYKELQSALKSLKSQGLTDIKLNSKKAALQAEYDRLTSPSQEQLEAVKVSTELVENWSNIKENLDLVKHYLDNAYLTRCQQYGVYTVYQRLEALKYADTLSFIDDISLTTVQLGLESLKFCIKIDY